MGLKKKGGRDYRFETPMEDLPSEEGDDNAWAVSYGDVISVLLTFLFLLLSISEINAKKYEAVKQQVKQADEEIKVDEIFKELSKVVKEQGISQYVDIKPTATGVEVNIGEKLLFGSGSANIKRQNNRALSKVIDSFKTLPKQYRFSIEGHTDDVPIKSREFPSNWHLSSARALSVLGIFLRRGFDDQRFSVNGLADTKPLVAVKDSLGRVIPGNREKNRRVLIKVQ